MSSTKTCPVCGTTNPASARFCNQCGTALPIAAETNPNKSSNPLGYDHRFGETDLMESDLRWHGGTVLVISVVALLIAACGGAFFALGGPSLLNTDAVNATDSPPTATTDPRPSATQTERPTIFLMTVTQAPPTATDTPTPGPCVIEVGPGDSMISIVARCGHRDLAVIDEVLEINGLDDPGLIRQGQRIEVPRPTDPAAEAEAPAEGDEVSSAEDDGGSVIGSILLSGVDESVNVFAPTATPTLPPGVMWHTVQSGENIISVAFQYGADVEIMSQLNPEITFSQCDFGEAAGGPNCIVQLGAGQLVRVPAPTPTPTVPPTATGSETPTPTATATFNAPSLVSPGNRVLFSRSELITLRWVGTGPLNAGDVYRVRVTDETTGVEFTMDTTENSLIVPTAWQASEGIRHDYTWQVSVISLDNPTEPVFTTESRTFTWEAQGE